MKKLNDPKWQRAGGRERERGKRRQIENDKTKHELHQMESMGRLMPQQHRFYLLWPTCYFIFAFLIYLKRLWLFNSLSIFVVWFWKCPSAQTRILISILKIDCARKQKTIVKLWNILYKWRRAKTKMLYMSLSGFQRKRSKVDHSLTHPHTVGILQIIHTWEASF